eukprot:NODE_1434_length_1142_cov_279.042318.p1 GENE.NODE_1434_length_1142_cov_279.042318~~NODE_1434_length_1142_cov_279.042318.p1  ORF type:complete len:265 (-),score=87.25 NODE_1434_length_1142_cov_279.042318:113-907(-)
MNMVYDMAPGGARRFEPPTTTDDAEIQAVRLSQAGARAAMGSKEHPGTPFSFSMLDKLTRLVVQSYTIIDVAPTHGQSPEMLGPSYLFKVFTGFACEPHPSEQVRWLQERPELCELVLRAFRYAVKIAIDCVAMGEDAAALNDNGLESALVELDESWHVGDEASAAWQAAMEQRQPQLMALRCDRGVEYKMLRLTLAEDDVRVGRLNADVVQSIWASASLELRYFTNDDEERYSIQAHPTLLHNMAVQSAEYPIYVSPPTTVWL